MRKTPMWMTAAVLLVSTHFLGCPPRPYRPANPPRYRRPPAARRRPAPRGPVVVRPHPRAPVVVKPVPAPPPVVVKPPPTPPPKVVVQPVPAETSPGTVTIEPEPKAVEPQPAPDPVPAAPAAPVAQTRTINRKLGLIEQALQASAIGKGAVATKTQMGVRYQLRTGGVVAIVRLPEDRSEVTVRGLGAQDTEKVFEQIVANLK